MYKVFSNDRIFFFTDDIGDISINRNDLILKYFGSYDLSDFWKIVNDNEKQKIIIVYSDKIKLLINSFESNYKILTAAGGIVENLNDEILLIERLGKYDLPKGKTENNEKVEETAIREVEEECGITGVFIENKIQVTQHTYILKGKYILKKTHWYKMSYNGDLNLTPQSEEDITNAFWIKKTKIMNLLNEKNTYLSILDIFSILEY